MLGISLLAAGQPLSGTSSLPTRYAGDLDTIEKCLSRRYYRYRRQPAGPDGPIPLLARICAPGPKNKGSLRPFANQSPGLKLQSSLAALLGQDTELRAMNNE